MKTALATTETSARAWQVIQNERTKRQYVAVEPPSRFAVPDDTPLVQPSQIVINSGQWEPGKVLHACPLTKEGRLLFGMKNIQNVGVIDPIQERGSAGVTDISGGGNNNKELSEEQTGSLEAT